MSTLESRLDALEAKATKRPSADTAGALALALADPFVPCEINVTAANGSGSARVQANTCVGDVLLPSAGGTQSGTALLDDASDENSNCEPSPVNAGLR